MTGSYIAAIGSRSFTVAMDDSTQIIVDGKAYDFDFKDLGGSSFSLILGGKTFTICASTHGLQAADERYQRGSYDVQINSRYYSVVVEDEKTHDLLKLFQARSASAGTQVIRAPMPGLITRLEVCEGSEVTHGSGLLVLEAMKMENEIRSPIKGKVTALHVEKGRAVEKGEPLLTILSE